MQNETKVNVTTNENEIVIRHGEAAELEPISKVKIIGDIDTVVNYVKHRKPDVNLCHVVQDKKAFTAVLHTNPKFETSPIVEARLEKNDLLNELGVNTGKKYSRDELIQVLRFNRTLFPNTDEYARLLGAVNDFTAKVDISLQQSGDNRGNKVSNFGKTVKSDVPLNSVIFMPLFTSFEPVKLTLDICFDVTAQGAIFWLESLDLKTIIEKAANDTFDSMRATLEDLGVLVISK
jgi:hypothetical protein